MAQARTPPARVPYLDFLVVAQGLEGLPHPLHVPHHLLAFQLQPSDQ
jgi:hypothetical protein